RIANPDSIRTFNIVFTHTQASYDGDDLDEAKEHFETRRLQLLAIEELIQLGLTPEERDREEVIVMGDLNIDGDPADPDTGINGMAQQDLYEWNTRFNNPSFEN